MINWYSEGARDDGDPQRFDAIVGHLHLRVVEIVDEGPHHYRWGVSVHEHPPFADDVAELGLAMGNHVTERGAKTAARKAVLRVIHALHRDLGAAP